MRFRRPPAKGWSGMVMDLTPLIDVVFLLLIFFLLTTAPAPDPTMAVRLPEASSGRTLALPEEVVLFMRSDGTLILEGRRVSVENLSDILREMKKNRNISRVVLKGDTAARYGMVVKVLDAVTAAQLPLGVAVRRQDAEGGHE